MLWLRPALLVALVLLGQPRAPAEEPGDHVLWLEFPVQKGGSHPAWGRFLNDIENHLPERYGGKYASADAITHAHETTHAINSHITNHFNDTGKPAYGFYVGENKAALLLEPTLKLSQVAPFIPQALRGSRYHLYFIEQQKYFENQPLYLLDEWTAYTNGALAGIELAERSADWDSRCDAVVGSLEFSVYGIGLALAIKQHDPDYLRTNRQFTEFLAHELRRSAAVYRRGILQERFRWERSLEATLLQSEDARAFRALVADLYGPRLTLEKLLQLDPGPDTPARPHFFRVHPLPPPVLAGSIEGTVRDEDERLQPELKVLLKDGRGRVVAETLTDSSGWFTLKEVAPGVYRVSAARLIGAKGSKPVQVRPGENARADFEIR
jgi:hypothetical protein